jgi:type IX secretion system substrate protein
MSRYVKMIGLRPISLANIAQNAICLHKSGKIYPALDICFYKYYYVLSKSQTDKHSERRDIPLRERIRFCNTSIEFDFPKWELHHFQPPRKEKCMMRLNHLLALICVLGLLVSSTSVAQIVFSVGPGTGAPPPTLGPYPMTAFAADPAGLGATVTTAPGPNGNVTFNQNMTHYKIGSGWATWSHGYTGDVYSSQGSQTISMAMPPNTVACYFYAEPNTYAVFTVKATAQDGTNSGLINVHGNSGATYFGFYSTNGVALANISVVVGAGSSGFAVGEFGISQCAPPTISVMLTPDMLWPPNHKMANIRAAVRTTGTCGGNVVTLLSVTSNEPDNGPDDGNTINDIQDVTTGVADYAFKLRKERCGTCTGRIYTATYKVVDQYGSMDIASATVTVPLSMSKSSPISSAVPSTLELEQNYPNPFNPSTTIEYGVPYDGRVSLTIYDMRGREIKTLVDEHQSAGSYSVNFHADGQPSGTYIYRLTLNGETTYQTMTLSK